MSVIPSSCPIGRPRARSNAVCMAASHGGIERMLSIGATVRLLAVDIGRWQQRLRSIVCAVLAGCLLSSVCMAAAAPEYRIKAVFLFQFAQFVEWPQATSDAAPFAICVLGEDPFNEYLDETVSGEAVKGRQLTVRRYRQGEDLKSCSILFIAQSEAERLDAILAGLRGEPVLTVSDTSRFAERGGTVEFVTVNNKIKLRINADAAKDEYVT